MEMAFDLYSTPWNHIVSKENNDELSVELKNKLKGKEYWAVHFRPEQKSSIVVFGGDVTIFIDSSSGEILAVNRGL